MELPWWIVVVCGVSVVLEFPWDAAVIAEIAGTPRVTALATGPLVRAHFRYNNGQWNFVYCPLASG